MTQNNQRKEPVFGEPLPLVENETTLLNTAENNTTTVAEQGKIESKTEAKPYVSLHSTQSPGHTFTPIMKRPEAPAEANVANGEQAAQSTQTETENANVKAFTFTPAEDSSTMNPPETESNEPLKIKVDETVATEGFTTERIIPNAAAGAAVASAAAVANEKTKAKMSPKARRLLLVALLALVLLVLFFLLKPNTPETVEELQSQGSSLPIEFRPVDEAEAKRAEEQARAEQEAAKQQEAQVTEQAQTAPASQPTENTAATQNDATMESKPVSQVVENKPVVSQPAVKPQTQGSVVYQPETSKAQPKPQPKVERLTPQAPKETAKATVKPAEKPAAEKVAPKTTVKPEAEVAKAAAKTTATASTKTMTVPKGVSLMQVFRDNNLNIADVNAMSKVNSIVSNLKVGERVTVRLDNNNRVVEMSIGSGGKFTRQANGSYTFK